MTTEIEIDAPPAQVCISSILRVQAELSERQSRLHRASWTRTGREGLRVRAMLCVTCHRNSTYKSCLRVHLDGHFLSERVSPRSSNVTPLPNHHCLLLPSYIDAAEIVQTVPPVCYSQKFACIRCPQRAVQPAIACPCVPTADPGVQHCESNTERCLHRCMMS